MDDFIFAMPEALQDRLDALVSARSSVAQRTQALADLDQLVARTFTATKSTEILQIFCSLQDTFECNISSRLLSWISGVTPRFEGLIARGPDREAEVSTLSSHLTQCLTIIQGVALTHHASKVFLGRKYPLEVLLDLLLVSRHLSSSSTDSTTKPGSSGSSTSSHTTASTPAPTSIPLASAILDTLLCILVDCSPALRTFEESNGVQVVVKILKRVNTPREVRMKCLEFLYFYLMDETSPSTMESVTRADQNGPVTPLSPSPFISDGKPKSRTHGSSLRDTSSSSDDSFTSNSSHSSSLSMSSTSSVSSSTTVPPSSPPSNPTKSPPQSPASSAIEPNSKLHSLRRDVDAPVTPKKAPMARLGKGHARTSSMPLSGSKLKRSSDLEDDDRDNAVPVTPNSTRKAEEASCYTKHEDPKTRTAEEKKKLLGNMLGNVDALVEGVRKAGIWGLG